MLDKPQICSTFSINVNQDLFSEDFLYYDDETVADAKKEYIEKEAEIRYKEFDNSLKGMNRRARTAELILGLVIVLILNLACISYFKMYNKKSTEDQM
jgi:hypothetical protein